MNSGREAELSGKWERLAARLAGSAFRSRFKLAPRELLIISGKGFGTVERHCREIVESRLAPAFPKNDGGQTPMRGHPCFIAQHATAACCRGCLGKWHAIGRGHQMTEREIEETVYFLMRWIRAHAEILPEQREMSGTPDLFAAADTTPGAEVILRDTDQ